MEGKAMAVKIWNTRKLMFFGAMGGAIFSWLIGPRTELLAAGSDAIAGAIAEVIGGAIGGAILLAIISGVLNLLARKKTE